MLTARVDDAMHSNSTREMLMTEFLDWWEAERPAGGKLLYLKDWTLAAQQPQYNAYVCPAHFQVTDPNRAVALPAVCCICPSPLR
jgi:hypothetical protein